MRYLLDTNHLSHALRVDSPLRERVFQKRRQGNRMATCWPAPCELEDGLTQLVDDKRHRRMLAVLLG
jgi:predicted nucleic acid-binding protein